MRALLLIAAVATVAACKDQPNPLACESDSECGIPGTRCNTETKLCVCVTDEACEDGFFCNTSGVCQERSGCSVNAECTTSGTYCDISTGQCLVGPPTGLEDACGLASHCPYGTICTAGQCVAGCFDDGDCPLGQICLDGQCATGTDVCSNDLFCDYGERCQNLSCIEDHRGPYCRGCTPATIQNPTPCDHPRNFCLVNSFEDTGHFEICGVDCSLGQPCPNGYRCLNVLILTQQPCGATAECQCSQTPTYAGVCRTSLPCQPGAGRDFCRYDDHPDCGVGGSCFVATGTTTGSCTCVTDDDCDDGATCVSQLCCPRGSTVRTDRECRVGENRVSGYCSCATDDDCPRDSCDGASSTCALTGLPCTPGGNDCGPLSCIDGACLIGQNCGPDEGLSCSILGAR
jgi:hypothetical protein